MSSAIQNLAFAIGGTLVLSLSVHAEPPVAPFYQAVARLAPTGKLGEVIKREKVSTSIKGAQNGEFLPPLMPGSNPIQFRNCTRAYARLPPVHFKEKDIMKIRNLPAALACAALLTLAGATADACTSLVLNGNDAGRVYGRTMEFGIPLHSQAMQMPRGFANTGIGPDGTPGKGKPWTSKYAVVGANVFGLPFYVDGMNEAGLAGGLLNAPNTARYQDVPAGQEANSIAPQQLLTYVLTNFATVGEVRQALGNLYVSNAPMKEWGGTPKARMTLHDARGGSIVVEYLDGRLVITDNVIGVMTNDPAFSWHLANIGNYANLGGLDKKPLTVKGQVFPPASSGNGLHGIPGSMLSSDRFVRASLYVLNTPTDAPTAVQRSRAWHILNNFDIPYGSIYLDASSGYGGGANAYEFTEWTVVADLKNKTYSIRSFENPGILTLDFKGFDLNGKAVTNKPLLK